QKKPASGCGPGPNGIAPCLSKPLARNEAPPLNTWKLSRAVNTALPWMRKPARICFPFRDLTRTKTLVSAPLFAGAVGAGCAPADRDHRLHVDRAMGSARRALHDRHHADDGGFQ